MQSGMVRLFLETTRGAKVRLSLALLASNLVLVGAFSQEHKSEEGILAQPKKTHTDLKGLKGKWEGTFKWTGDIQATGLNTVGYYLTGNGSTIIENMIAEDGTASMSSAYYLDEPSLKMTHFCAAKNHPRLVATDYGHDTNRIKFKIIDITNLSHEKAGHVYEVHLELLDSNHLNITFKYIRDGKISTEAIQLELNNS